jgi:hypothetical protein
VSTPTPAEWVAFLSLGLSISSAVSIPFWLFVDADLADFDPRLAVRRAVESGRYDRLLCAAANAKHDTRAAVDRARRAPRDAAISAAALLLLLSPAAPEATR